VQLPRRVQSDKAQAEFHNGVLHLRLPKAEETKPRTIPVRSTQGQKGQAQSAPLIEGTSRPATAVPVQSGNGQNQ
jgi:hypothetical protein